MRLTREGFRFGRDSVPLRREAGLLLPDPLFAFVQVRFERRDCGFAFAHDVRFLDELRFSRLDLGGAGIDFDP